MKAPAGRVVFDRIIALKRFQDLVREHNRKFHG